MTISSAGAVGIGTLTPQAAIHAIASGTGVLKEFRIRIQPDIAASNCMIRVRAKLAGLATLILPQEYTQVSFIIMLTRNHCIWTLARQLGSVHLGTSGYVGVGTAIRSKAYRSSTD